MLFLLSQYLLFLCYTLHSLTNFSSLKIETVSVVKLLLR